MAVRDLSELAAPVQEEIEGYLRELESGFCGVEDDIASEAVADVRGHLLDRLHATSTVEDARALVDEFGRPDEYAKRLCAEVRSTVPHPPTGTAEDLAEPRGRVLGMPYDLKLPTAANIGSRMWNPHNPRVFTPRLLGIGWSINFAALAVRLGLIRPDDEDEPFASVPEAALWAALFVPVVLCGAVVIAVAVSWSGLPGQVAIHWDVSGRPDDFATPAVALWPLIAFAVLPAGYALWAFVVGRSKAARAVVSAFATTFCVLSAAIVAATLAEAAGGRPGPAWPWIALLAALGLPFALLFGLSRLGHAAEVRMDLKSTDTKDTR